MVSKSLLLVAILAGCGGGKGGQVPVSNPVMAYEAPDIEDLTGIDPDEEAEPPEGTCGPDETEDCTPAEGTPPASAAH